MQAVKDKLSDMNAMRKIKAETKAEEKAEKELAKARMDIAHEVRLAKEAEAEMDLHVAKAGEKAEREVAKHTPEQSTQGPAARGNNIEFADDQTGTGTGTGTGYPTSAPGASINTPTKPLS